MSHNVGRHRAPGRYNPAAELGQIITEAGTPLAKGSAVVAASGGLVAAIAIPAQASPVETTEPAPQAVSAVQSANASEKATMALEQAVAVTAPEAKASEKATKSFGTVAVEPVAKPTGPSEAELRERAERAERAESAAAERRAEQEAAAEAAQPAREQAEERQESAPSRSQERQAPSQESSEPSAPAPEPAPSSGGVISIAKQYIGTPYLYGGTTPAGFDCSGFTQYVFGKAGISLPRTTTAQQAATTPVSDPQPGDLVFFGSPAYHMGIYLGDGMMIDSPSSGKSVSIRPVFSGVSGYGRV